MLSLRSFSRQLISRPTICCNRFESSSSSSSSSSSTPSSSTPTHISKKSDEPEDLNKLKKELKDLPEKQVFWEYGQKECGHIYDKKPIKVQCVEGKMYLWCSCGRSNNQPFCDGTHKVSHYKIKLRPIPFKCKETKDYWFCNCKQTRMRPFCDGTHKEEFVKKAESTIRY